MPKRIVISKLGGPDVLHDIIKKPLEKEQKQKISYSKLSEQRAYLL